MHKWKHKTKSLVVFPTVWKKGLCIYIPFFPFSLVNSATFWSTKDYLSKLLKKNQKGLQRMYQVYSAIKGLVGEDLLFVQVHMPTTKLFWNLLEFPILLLQNFQGTVAFGSKYVFFVVKLGSLQIDWNVYMNIFIRIKNIL